MNTLNDLFVSLGKDNKNIIDVKSEFIYNKYQKNETLTDDTLLNLGNNERTFTSENSKIKNKFIRLFLPDDYFESSNVNISDLTNLVPELIELSNDSINKQTREFFNLVEEFQNYRKNLVLDINKTSYKEFINFFSTFNINEESNNDNNDLKNDGSSYFSVNSEFYEKYKECFLNSNYNMSKTIKNIEDLENITKAKNINFLKEKSSPNKVLNGNFFPDIEALSFEINYSNADVLKDILDINCSRCGIYIEKYRLEKNDINKSYSFLCGKFITIKPGQNFNDIPTIFEDENIKYGETYRYVVRDVYFYVIPTYMNRFTLSRFLLCDLPFVTQDIVCKESVKPIPLEDIGFSYHNNNLCIYWGKNYDNYQNDIKGYQILRRNSLKEPFRLIAQLEGHDSHDFYEIKEIVRDELKIKTPGNIPDSYIDNSYDFTKNYIYAIRSIDAHGLISNYSTQFGVEFNYFEKKLIVETVSTSNSPIRQPNLNILTNTSFFDEEYSVVENLPSSLKPKKICLYYTPEFNKITTEESTEETDIFNINTEKNYLFSIFKVNENVEFKKDIKITTNT